MEFVVRARLGDVSTQRRRLRRRRSAARRRRSSRSPVRTPRRCASRSTSGASSSPGAACEAARSAARVVRPEGDRTRRFRQTHSIAGRDRVRARRGQLRGRLAGRRRADRGNRVHADLAHRAASHRKEDPLLIDSKCPAKAKPKRRPRQPDRHSAASGGRALPAHRHSAGGRQEARHRVGRGGAA